MASSLSPQDFVAKWKDVDLTERSASQSHFNDLCDLLGEAKPVQADPTGKGFTFEAGASKSTGGEGWADVWKKGYFAWEYKGKHADLDKAYRQLLLYREDLQNPPLLIVSDLSAILIHTNFTNTPKSVYRLELNDLLNPEKLQLLRHAFTDPSRLRKPDTVERVTQEAATHFARLSDLLRKYGEDPQKSAHFLIRLLFCMFAEDVGILPDGLFSRLAQKPYKNANAFTQLLRQLFAAMASGGTFGADDISHVDGGLFEDDTALDLDSEGLKILATVSNLDWASIEPSIFGTLFERSLDPAKRAQLGAHYTSRADILLVVEPVLMAPLRQRWYRARQQALELGAGLDQAERRNDGKRKTALRKQLHTLFTGLAAELAGVQVLDPACGSGNFLYVALRQLLDLEKEVITFARTFGVGLFPSVSPSQLHGLETNAFAYELASATIWIGYIQWLRDNGFGLPGEPILKPLDSIRRTDAIMDTDETGKPIDPAWPAVNVIIGNPPFLGGKRLRAQLGDDYVNRLFELYDGRVPREADLVCYWFEKARAAIEAGSARRVGLLATQGIRGGANRKVLKRIKETGDIFWAQADRKWILDGAAVHVSMVGFDAGTEQVRYLDEGIVSAINSDLTSSTDLTTAMPLAENANIAFMGDTKGGAFDIPGVEASRMLRAPLNPNGRPNSDVVKAWANGFDVAQRPRGMWIIDFGATMPEAEAALYEAPFEYVRKHVKETRALSRTTRPEWWLHERPRPEMRQALAPLSRYAMTPSVAKHRLFVWMDKATLPDHAAFVFARDDDYFLGVLQSRIHERWARRQGTQLREAVSGSRYTPRTTFDTFPFPWPPGKEPSSDPNVHSIAAAAKELVERRDAWLNPPGATAEQLKQRTLTSLYNQRPTWLAMAHERLDHAVLDAYGWPRDISDDDLLAHLLQLNQARAALHNHAKPAG